MASTGAWRPRAFTGDAHAPLLLPHQLLVARADALQLPLADLTLVTVSAAVGSSSASSLALECVVCRQIAPGSVQLPTWALDALELREGDAVVISAVSAAAADATARGSVELSVVRKFPAALSGVSGGADAALRCLPESVRSGAVDLERALQRQLQCRSCPALAAAGLARNQLLAAQVLRETFVFRVESVRVEAPGAPDASAALLDVRVRGWRREEREQETSGSAAVADPPAASSDTLESRLERAGVAGYDAFVRDVLLNIALVTKGDARAGGGFDHLQIGSHGLLLSGVPGVGKSLMLRALHREAERSGILVKRIDGTSLLMESEATRLASTYEFLAQQVQDAFPTFDAEPMQRARSATAQSRCTGVLLIDDVDVLFQTPSGETADESDAVQGLSPLGSSLLRLLDAISESSRICVVGATTSADTKIPFAARRAGRFGKTLEILVPTERMRTSILAHHLRALPLSSLEAEAAHVEVSTHLVASRLAALTGGYVAKDLVRICRNALVQAHKAAAGAAMSEVGALRVTWEHLVAAQQLVKPSQLRELNVASPGAAPQSSGGVAAPSGFAGYAALQKQLVDFITWKFRPTAAMHRLGVADASGVLVHGPSGCGKSLLVRTLAARAGVNFVSVKSSEIMSKYFGDSEKAVRELFARARAASPCILFFDEFDAIAHKRSFGDGDGDGGGESVYARILSTFLNEMDGVGASAATETKGEILVIAATSRVDALDAALVRPGRIDKTIELGLPAAGDKEEILAHYTRNMPLEPDVSIGALAARSTGDRPFTGADLAAVCKDAALRALREDVDAARVSMRHFDAAWDRRVARPLGVPSA